MSAQRSALLRTRLERALASGDARLTRLGAADTSITFRDLDDPSASVTLLLDRQPPLVAGPDEPAEITIELTREQATRFARGTFSLPNAMVTGEAGYRGPVRKYLAIDPVLRGLLAEVDLDVETQR